MHTFHVVDALIPMWKNIHMENNPSFQDSLAVERPETPTRKSYLPVYIAVFFLIVVLIIVTGVLMRRPVFINRSSDVILEPKNDLVAICEAYAATYPFKDGVGVYSAGLVTVGSKTYCELVFVGSLVTLDEEKFELAYPGKLQSTIVYYDSALEIVPLNNINTFPPEFYERSVFEKLSGFKDLSLGVTIEVRDDSSFFAHEVSVGGRLLNSAETKELESSMAVQP